MSDFLEFIVGAVSESADLWSVLRECDVAEVADVLELDEAALDHLESFVGRKRGALRAAEGSAGLPDDGAVFMLPPAVRQRLLNVAAVLRHVHRGRGPSSGLEAALGTAVRECAAIMGPRQRESLGRVSLGPRGGSAEASGTMEAAEGDENRTKAYYINKFIDFDDEIIDRDRRGSVTVAKNDGGECVKVGEGPSTEAEDCATEKINDLLKRVNKGLENGGETESRESGGRRTEGRAVSDVVESVRGGALENNDNMVCEVQTLNSLSVPNRSQPLSGRSAAEDSLNFNSDSNKSNGKDNLVTVKSEKMSNELGIGKENKNPQSEKKGDGKVYVYKSRNSKHLAHIKINNVVKLESNEGVINLKEKKSEKTKTSRNEKISKKRPLIIKQNNDALSKKPSRGLQSTNKDIQNVVLKSATDMSKKYQIENFKEYYDKITMVCKDYFDLTDFRPMEHYTLDFTDKNNTGKLPSAYLICNICKNEARKNNMVKFTLSQKGVLYTSNILQHLKVHFEVKSSFKGYKAKK